MVSSVLKARLRDSLESLQKSIYAIKSEALMQKVEAEALLLREVKLQPRFVGVLCQVLTLLIFVAISLQHLVSLVEKRASQAVLTVNVGSEARAIKRINDEIKSVRRILFFFIIIDRNKGLIIALPHDINWHPLFILWFYSVCCACIFFHCRSLRTCRISS